MSRFHEMHSKLSSVHKKTASVVIFGEVLYDHFSGGERLLGGAPFNVAWALQGFGLQPLFVSAVGDDGAGRNIRRHMLNWGMNVEGLERHNLSTGKVIVNIKDDEPSYDICYPRAWDYITDQGIEATEFLYYGSLALRNETTRNTLKAIADRSSCVQFFDINVRLPYYDQSLVDPWLTNVDWLKLNIDELRMLANKPITNFRDATSYVDAIRKKYTIPNILLTGGKDGAIIRGESGNAALLPAPEPHTFVDAVGAGDAFCAFFIKGLFRGEFIKTLLKEASLFASRVCGIQGATCTDQMFYET